MVGFLKRWKELRNAKREARKAAKEEAEREHRELKALKRNKEANRELLEYVNEAEGHAKKEKKPIRKELQEFHKALQNVRKAKKMAVEKNDANRARKYLKLAADRIKKAEEYNEKLEKYSKIYYDKILKPNRKKVIDEYGENPAEGILKSELAIQEKGLTRYASGKATGLDQDLGTKEGWLRKHELYEEAHGEGLWFKEGKVMKTLQNKIILVEKSIQKGNRVEQNFIELEGSIWIVILTINTLLEFEGKIKNYLKDEARNIKRPTKTMRMAG